MTETPGLLLRRLDRSRLGGCGRGGGDPPSAGGTRLMGILRAAHSIRGRPGVLMRCFRK
jgi:hypothetical protein